MFPKSWYILIAFVYFWLCYGILWSFSAFLWVFDDPFIFCLDFIILHCEEMSKVELHSYLY